MLSDKLMKTLNQIQCGLQRAYTGPRLAFATADNAGYGCHGSCSGTCMYDCDNGCSGDCEGSCTGDCSGSCSDGCSGDCKDSCYGRSF